ncbi:unnamed protein product [Darwinula stevensoni]|uniref:Dynein heavy chain tail domain-containing protein n=1 Tax=Darwinula stevensoni TaxID=69355 RepID=A0A7R8XF17_9CRUS|nr:unnamed protein product [Darwinula stevensoni]CAG0890146.1 unnamed protein product [Darwinula stevensoni]
MESAAEDDTVGDDSSSSSDETRKKLTTFFAAPSHTCILLSVERGKAVVADEPPHTPPRTPPQARGKRLRGIYLLKVGDGATTMENFHTSVAYGTIGGDVMESLIDFIRHYHCSIIRDSRALPEDVASDLSTETEKFLAFLYGWRSMHGATPSLYIPEDFSKLTTEDARDQATMEIVEGVVMQWVGQMRQMAAWKRRTPTVKLDSGGPLAEISVWRKLCEQLEAMTQHANSPKAQHVIEILRAAHSTHAKQFLKLTTSLQKEKRRCESNVKYLSVLRKPCELLARSRPIEIPTQLPSLLGFVRAIWIHSPNYNTKLYIIGLLQRLTNDILGACQQFLHLDEILSGEDTDRSSQRISECKFCCSEWKAIYKQVGAAASDLGAEKSLEYWEWDTESVFVHVDTFVARLNDLQEITDAQQHFLRLGKVEVPHQSRVLVEGLGQVEQLFRKALDALREGEGSHHALDIQDTAWHEDMARFRGSLKEVEHLMRELIQQLSKSFTNLSEAIDTFNIFRALGQREALRPVIKDGINKVWDLLDCELRAVEQELRRLRDGGERYARTAIRTRWLSLRVQQDMIAVKRAGWIQEIHRNPEIEEHYLKLKTSLDAIPGQMFAAWVRGLDFVPESLLRRSLLVPCKGRPGLLELNFDPQASVQPTSFGPVWLVRRRIEELWEEAGLWEEEKFQIPRQAVEVHRKRVELYFLRQLLLDVLHRYNKALSALSENERQLLKIHLSRVDRVLSPGITKHQWADVDSLTEFPVQALAAIAVFEGVVSKYEGLQRALGGLVMGLSGISLYEAPGTDSQSLDWPAWETGFRESIKKGEMEATVLVEKLRSCIDGVQQLVLKDTDEGEGVKKEWGRYGEQAKRILGQGVGLCLKNSLGTLLESLRQPSSPILISLSLSSDSKQVRLDSWLREVVDVIGDALRAFLAVFDPLSALPLVGNGPGLKALILRDPEIVQIQRDINRVLEEGCEESETRVRSIRDRFHPLWGMEPGIFLQEYKHLTPSSSAWKNDLHRHESLRLPHYYHPISCFSFEMYESLQEEVESLEEKVPAGVFLLDLSSLKTNLLNAGKAWLHTLSKAVNEK